MKKDFKFKVERSPYLQVSAAMARGRCVLRHAAVVVACIALMLVSGVEGEADAAEVVERATDQEGLWSAPPAEGATRNRPGAQRGRLPWLRTAVLARNPQLGELRARQWLVAQSARHVWRTLWKSHRAM